MYSFVIWIDADSCPLLVRNYVIDCAKSKSMNVSFVANRKIPFPKDNPLFKMCITEKKTGSADDFIFENAKGADVVITRDIVFAARLVEKKICVMNDRGTIFTKDNIKERLLERNFYLNMAELGFGSNDNRYGQKEFKKFETTFERVTAQLRVNETFSRKK
ncbi:DUF188 domain-containing protein [Treponema pectinovorum]|uniref:DUF188 domain-containing protein n=1 Tax=Treponema pectinovorum TaxID=164 RepID=UPI003D8F554E